MSESVCIVCLDPRGNQEFCVDDIEMGSVNGTYLYLVHTSREHLSESVDNEVLGGRYDYEDGDEAYCELFESMCERAGIQVTRLPDKCFEIYSTLY
jgi:hypothetical protein